MQMKDETKQDAAAKRAKGGTLRLLFAYGEIAHPENFVDHRGHSGGLGFEGCCQQFTFLSPVFIQYCTQRGLELFPVKILVNIYHHCIGQKPRNSSSNDATHGSTWATP